MIQVQLVPTLSSCIETTAKREYWQTVNDYIQGGALDEKVAGRIELLKAFLESADFRELRKESERYLIEDKKVKFLLSLAEGKLECELEVTE